MNNTLTMPKGPLAKIRSFVACFILIALFQIAFSGPSWADVYINVVAVNGSDQPVEKPIKYTLPGELKADDILDTDALKLEYNVNEGGYFVTGTFPMEPKETKTFRIRVRDVWKITEDEVAEIEKQVAEGSQKLVKEDELAGKNAGLLKDQLTSKLAYILEEQKNSAESVEQRIDNYRIHKDQLNVIKRNALSVDYWRSTPGEDPQLRSVRMVIEVENPPNKPAKNVKHQHYLPAEIKPEHIINREGFEIRFDEAQKKPFLFKEELFEPGEKKRYEINLQDIWFIHQIDLDYVSKRATYARDFLKESKYAQTAQMLYDKIMVHVEFIEVSQEQKREIKDHIGAFRVNRNAYKEALADLEQLEKILAIYRETLEKSKVENVLQKIRTLKSVAEIAASIFKKKFKITTTWKIIIGVLIFVGIYTFIHFMIWWRRSAAKKREEEKKNKSS